MAPVLVGERNATVRADREQGKFHSAASGFACFVERLRVRGSSHSADSLTAVRKITRHACGRFCDDDDATRRSNFNSFDCRDCGAQQSSWFHNQKTLSSQIERGVVFFWSLFPVCVIRSHKSLKTVCVTRHETQDLKKTKKSPEKTADHHTQQLD